jgi:hypothetical protein
MDRARRIVRRLIKPVALLAAAVLAGIAGASLAGTEGTRPEGVDGEAGT